MMSRMHMLTQAMTSKMDANKIVDHHRKYPKAIHEDQNPFGLFGFLPSYLRLLIFLRWTAYKCPHCGHVFRRDFWSANFWLGPGDRICKNCGDIFDDGSREWPELSMARKFRIFFPPLLVGISGGFMLAGVLTLFLPVPDWRVVLFASVIALLPALLWSLIRLPWVIRSIHRYNGAVLTPR
jgi:hypothetical protein